MTQPVEVTLDLNGNYTDQVGVATQATAGLAAAVNTLQAPSRGVQQALDYATPTKAHIAAWGGFTAAAGYFQSQTSGIRATASATGQSVRSLDSDVQGLARTFPIGTQGAVALVQAVQGLAVQQPRVRPLAMDFERLAVATNSMGPSMAAGFGQLNREMASLDPARLTRYGDVLTTVSARSGAAAMGIVSFSQAIAPVAQQAGLGESAVLGISSAFVKLGDDGGAAATAVNKILGDLNRSVREGSNDMAAYAQITGMTVDKFRQLYQSNPAQALAAVTTAIGRAGPRGQMELESLGLEGVRTQRALLQLSQSGGLQDAVNQAIGAYGNGSTQRAAAAALNGLDTSITELRSTAGQTANALGGPFLHVLTKIIDVAKTGLAPVNAALGSGVGQAGIFGLGGLAAAGLLARRVVRPLGMLAIGQQAVTSGPARSILGGYALGRTGGDVEAALGTRMGRYGQEAIAMQAYGAPYGRGFMQGINRGALRAGSIFGTLRSDVSGPLASDQLGPSAGGALRRGARVGIGLSSMAYEGYLRAFADPYHQSVTPAGERVSLMAAGQSGLFSQANQIRQQAGVRAALGFIEKEGTSFSASLSRMTSATIGATRAVGTFAGRTLEAGATAGGKVLGAAGSGLWQMIGGGLGAALIGGTAVYDIYHSAHSQVSDINSTMRNTDIYGVANSWADAVGEASKAATTMADAMASASNTINASITNFPAASTVSNADIVAAGNFHPSDQRRNSTLSYLGNNAAVTSLIQAGSLSGMTPADMQGVKMQLIKQGIPAARIDQILSGVNPGGTGGRLTSSTISGLVSAYGTAVSSYDKHGHGLLDTDAYAGRDAQKVSQAIVGALGQQQQDMTQQFGSRYATQQTVRAIAQVLRETPENQRFALSHALAASLGYKGSGGADSVAAKASSSGFPTYKTSDPGLLYLPGVSVGGMSGQQLVNLLSGPNIPAQMQPSIMEAPLTSAGATSLLPFFASRTATGPYAAGQAAAAYVASGHEADVSAQTKAVMQIVTGAERAGTSLLDLATQASKATSTTADWQQQLLEAISAEATFRQNVALQGAGRGVTLRAAVSSDLANLTAGPGIDPSGFQAKQYQQAKSDLASQRQEVISYYQQRVMVQYQYQIQTSRAQEDFQKQTSRSEQDFLIGRSRAWRDFNINLARQVQDASAQMYNPYQRIQAKPVWDAVNLAGNRSEQLMALRRQMVNIKELRKLGISQQTIDQLQLYDPNNAQQTMELVADLQSNRALVDQLNTQSQQIGSASAQLVTQSPAYRRQREDFRRSLADQQADFNRQQSRQRTDYTIAMSRMAQDLHTQDLEITNDMTALTRDMNAILAGQAVDLTNQVTTSLKNTLKVVHEYMPQINAALSQTGVGVLTPTTSSGVSATGSVSGGGYGNAPVISSTFSDTIDPRTGQPVRSSTQTSSYVAPGTGSVYTGAISGSGAGSYNYDPTSAFMNAHPADPNYNRSIAKKMMPGWSAGSQWTAWNNLWTRESGWNQYADNPSSDAYGIPQALPGTKMGTAGSDWRTNPATQIKWGVGYIRGRYGTPASAMAHESKYGWYGDGSVFTGPQVIGIGEQGPEVALPLNARGLEFMVSALHRYVSSTDAKAIAGTAGTVIIHHEYHHYDQRLDARGSKFDVKASDPKELSQAMLEHERAQNLVATRGVSRGGS